MRRLLSLPRERLHAIVLRRTQSEDFACLRRPEREEVLVHWARSQYGILATMGRLAECVVEACRLAPYRLTETLDDLVRGVSELPMRIARAWQQPLTRIALIAVAAILGCLLLQALLFALAAPRPFPPSYTPPVFLPGE